MIEAMKPKLIVLNGPLGSGKSTLAQKYAEGHPVTLNLDIDNVWSTISHWREQKEITGPLSKKLAVSMARIVLSEGHDVVVPQILQTEELANSFQTLADECNADYFEILLDVPKEESIKRFVARGKAHGHPSGFRAGGIIDTSGRETKLAEMHDNMTAVASNRLHVIKLEPILNDVDATYSSLLQILNQE
ncbi:MAG TPA: AAA family ATPase [Candidatus Saccharimonadales bacterium]|nr:AAA family ATPase [Candidatus Saccharimonadales bacterium]